MGDGGLRPPARGPAPGALVEAIALYDRAGYRRIERYDDNPHAEAWFEKDL